MARGDGRIEPGQRLTSAISARAWNRAQQAADIVLGSNPAAIAGSSQTLGPAPNVVMIRNDSGHPVPVCGVLAIDGVVIPPSSATIATSSGNAATKEFFRRPVFIGKSPTSATVGSVAIALEPVSVNGIGQFAIGGVFPCKVKMQSPVHRYARGRAADVTQLISASCGPVKLLYVEAGSGDDVWAVGVM